MRVPSLIQNQFTETTYHDFSARLQKQVGRSERHTNELNKNINKCKD